ncbi:metabotropic glycine receptor [Heterodontus francisci]|uniref:metabotropic glycine receptor n=1 Tax=Heterodontus francisci TaxID=7792 RepID=UPI00355C082C
MHHRLAMSVLRVILYIHMGVFGGFGRLQNHKSTPKPGLFREWNGPQFSTLVMSPEGRLDKPDPETSKAATYFLYSGDPSKLLQVNCTRRVEIRGMKAEAAVNLHSSVHGAIDTMIHATNFLNLVFQTNDMRESSVNEDIEWYHALVRSIVEGDAKIYRAMLILDVPTIPSKSQLVLQATKHENEIFLQDLSSGSDDLENQTADSEWFNRLKYQRTPNLNKRILNNDLQTLDTPKWGLGDSYMIDKSHIKWSSPFLDCEDYKFIPKWLMTLSSSFYGLKPDLSPEFKGVIRIDINLQSVDIDQCSTGNNWFAHSHQCDGNSTECTPLKGQGFQLGAYQCVCKEGYYNPNLISTNSFGRQDDKYISYFSRYAVEEPRRLFQCLPCKDGCGSCVSDAPCLTQVDWHLRLAVLSFQAFCMLLVFISMLLVYRCRKNKRIRASGLLLLETILGGSILLYFPVFILYFQPSVFRCVLLRWVRTLGFAIIYGTVTLKIYRVLKVFLSRTAQRVPYMTCCRVLKMLGVIVLTVCWFLIAWTVAAWENMDRKIPLVIQSQTPDGQTFNMCQLDRWDYMMATAEFLFLFWGSYLCYAVRTVPSTYHEPRFMGLAIHNEILMSAAFYGVRFTMAMTLHPDWMLLLFFAHSHLTVTMTLILLFIPKFLHVGAPLREDIVAEVYEDELDLRFSGSYLNSSITSAWSDHSLEPDDIRDELKKLYAQLEVHKTKKMTANNPHLQKKRSSRRALGRSIIKRITEIPESMSRQCSRDGSIAGGSYAGSYRKKLYDSSSMRVKEDSIKHRVFSIRKSHSTYDHVREHRHGHISRTDSSSRDPSLLDSLMRKKLAKKASERSDVDSLDDAPLVCKSASAHNLTVDRNPLNIRAGTLQKSLSVVSCAREKALMITKKYEENTKQVGDRVQKKLSTKQAPTKLQPSTTAAQSEEANKMTDSAKQQEAGELSQGTARPQSQDSHKTLVCPWDFQNLQPPPSETKVNKPVTYAPTKSSSVDNSQSSGKLQENRKRFADLVKKHRSLHQDSIGWDVKETQMIQSESEVSTDMQPGANTSPRIGKSVEYSRTDSIRPATLAVSPKANKTQIPSEKMDQVKTDAPVGESKREKYMSLMKQASSNSSIICPWETMVEETSAVDTSADQKKGRSLSVCVGTPEPLMHSSLKAKDANDPSKQPKGFGLSLKLLMAPGKMKESKKEKSRKASEKVKGGTDKEKEKENKTEAMSLRDKSAAAAICPWETGETKNKEEKSQSTDKVEDISPLHKVDTGDKQQKYRSLLKQASANTAIICPWDVILEETSALSISADQKKGRSLSVGAGVPGSLVHGTLKAKDANDSLQQSKRLALSLKLMMAPGKMWDRENKERKSLPIDNSKVADICPWDTGDAGSKEETSQPIDKSKVTDICPWDTGDTGRKEETSQPIDKSKVADICPWDTGDTGRKEETSQPIDKSKVADICPWDTGDTGRKEETSQPIDKSKVADICPWDTGDTGRKEETSQPIDKSKVADICPWDTGDTVNKEETSQPIDKPKVADICPWDTGDTGRKEETSQPIDKSKVTDICPWDTGDTGRKEETSQPIDKSKVADICPWDTGDTGRKEETSQPIDKSKVADICPWDTGDTGRKEETSQPIDKSKVTDICPWDTGDTVNKEETSQPIDKPKVADICPWDTGDTGRKEETSQPIDNSKVTDICPWDTGDTVNKEETSQPIDKSKVADICPWDTGDTGRKEETSQPIDKSKVADICPWDTGDTGRKEETSQSIDKSKVAYICPWDTGDTVNKEETSQPIDKSKVTDICPWDTGDTVNKGEISLPVDKSKVADICPWDTGDTVNKEETSQPIDKSKVADICPWDTGDTVNKGEISLPVDKSKVADICPWDTGDTVNKEETSQPIDKSKVADICPWDTGDTVNKEETSQPIDKSKVTDICPWDTGDTVNKGEISLPVGKSKVAYICPWDTGDTVNKEETSQPIDKSKVADICPWDTGDTVNKEETSQPIDKSKVSDICPWDTGDAGSNEETSQPIGKSKVTDICPWDTRDTVSKEELALPIDKSKVADTCPWDTGDTGRKEELSLSIDKSNVIEICLWETEASATGGIQTCPKPESNLTSISPWDVEVATANQPENEEAGNPKDKENVTVSTVSSPMHLV